jgi:hypothetical protein
MTYILNNKTSHHQRYNGNANWDFRSHILLFILNSTLFTTQKFTLQLGMSGMAANPVLTVSCTVSIERSMALSNCKMCAAWWYVRDGRSRAAEQTEQCRRRRQDGMMQS